VETIFVQVCRPPGVAMFQKRGVYRVSANRFSDDRYFELSVGFGDQ